MKFFRILTLILCLLLLLGCSKTPPEPVTVPPTETAEPETAAPETLPAAMAAPTLPPETQPEHSPLYIPGLSVEDVILYFNEVVLDAEITNSGDPSVVQKWSCPIRCILIGDYTETDLAVLTKFTQWLNTIEGFPGICQTEEMTEANLRIHFCEQEEMIQILGDHFWGMDAGVTFWYEDNEIYDATICYRTDLDQELRNSVILEEIYNGLGPVQDTDLRLDSIIYSGFSQPQALTQIDELLLKLLYHPDIRCGMNTAECEEIIRSLYY